jgi:nondiscriminating glutamyl-tRNA synthetase
VPDAVKLNFIELMRGTICFPEEAVAWATILFGEANALNFSIDSKIFLREVDPRYWQTLLTLLDEENSNFKVLIKQLQQKLNLKGKALFTPLRLALTGRHDGPELAKLFSLLGNEKIRERILHAKNL